MGNPYLSRREELNELNGDIKFARLELLNTGGTPRTRRYLAMLENRRRELLDELDAKHFRLPVGVFETVREDYDAFDMRDYNE